MAKYTTYEGDTVDRLLYRTYGIPITADILDAIHAVNPGLSRHGIILPGGVEVEIPILPSQPNEPLRLFS